MFRLKARLPVKPSITLSTSPGVRALSPGSGAVLSRASRSSATFTWPLSSSSKAEKADRSSALGDSAASFSASVFRKAGRAMVCADDGGKNCETSVELDGSPKYTPSQSSARFKEDGVPLCGGLTVYLPSWVSISATSSRFTTPSQSLSKI